MSSSKDAASDRADRVLLGQSNWIRWLPGFKADARADDTWSLFDGSETLLQKPARTTYVSSTRADASAELAEGATGPKIARQDLLYKQAIEEYKMDLHDYEQQHERVRRANKMLHERVDPSMQQDIQDMIQPKEALDHLTSLYKMQDSRAIQHTYNQIAELQLVDCASMTVYLNTLRQLKNDLKALGETYTDQQLINKIIKGLPKPYAGWVERYHDIAADPEATQPTLKSIEAQLISKETTLPKQTRTTAGSASGGNKARNKDPSKRADGTLRDKCAYEPCGKWGHKEEDCWLKHPDKRPEKKGVKSATTEASATISTSGAKPASLTFRSKPAGHSASATIDINAFETQLDEKEQGWSVVGGKKSKAKVKDYTNKTATSTSVSRGTYDAGESNPYQLLSDLADDSLQETEEIQSSTEGCDGVGRNDYTEQSSGSYGVSIDECTIEQLRQHFLRANDDTLHAAVATHGGAYTRDTWLLDSGCNTFICNDRAWFDRIHELDALKVSTADNTAALEVIGGGTVTLQLIDSDGDAFPLTLTKVAFAPGARTNLISLSKLAASGLKGNWSDAEITIESANGFVLGRAEKRGGLYHMILGKTPADTAVHQPIAALTDLEDPVWIWHRRLGHLSLSRMQQLLKMSNGIDLTEEQIKKKLGAVCPICATSRAIVNIPREPATRRAEDIGQLLHADSWGPYSIVGWDGTTRFVFVTDDASRMMHTVRIATPADAPDALKKLTKSLQTANKITIRGWRVDNEFFKGPFKVWCETKGMAIEPTAPHTHNQVGVAERKNRVIREGAAAMINDNTISGQLARIVVGNADKAMRNTNLPALLWPESVDHAAWLANRTPTRALKDKTPWETFHGTKPDLNKEKIWGCRVYVNITAEERIGKPKLHTDRAWVGYFVGMENESTYRVYNPEKNIVQRVAYAKVDEREGYDDPFNLASLDNVMPLPALEEGSDQSDTHDTAEDSDTEAPAANMADAEDFDQGFELGAEDIARLDAETKGIAARPDAAANTLNDDDEFGGDPDWTVEDLERATITELNTLPSTLQQTSGAVEIESDDSMNEVSPYFSPQSTKKSKMIGARQVPGIFQLTHTPQQSAALRTQARMIPASDTVLTHTSTPPRGKRTRATKTTSTASTPEQLQKKTKFSWNDEKYERVRTLKEDGYTYAKIADELGTTEQRVTKAYGRYKKKTTTTSSTPNQLQKTKKFSWNDEALRKLRELKENGCTHAEAADELGTTEQSVQKACVRYDIKSHLDVFEWTEQRDNELRKLKTDGATIQAIADKLGATKKIIVKRTEKLGLQTTWPWTDEEIQELRRGVDKHLFSTEIARRLGRTPVAVLDKAHSLGLKFYDRLKKGKCQLCRVDSTRCDDISDAPCQHCIAVGRHTCVWRSVDGSEKTVFVIKQREVDYDPEDDRCLTCRKLGRSCNRKHSDGPCVYCMTQKGAGMYVCTFFTAPGIMKRCDPRYFKIREGEVDDWEVNNFDYIIERDPAVTRADVPAAWPPRKSVTKGDRVFRGYTSDDSASDAEEDDDPLENYTSLPIGMSPVTERKLQSFVHSELNTDTKTGGYDFPLDPELFAGMATLDEDILDDIIDTDIVAMNAFSAHVDLAHAPVPNNRKEALAGPEAEEWAQAIDEEYNSLIENGTWTPTRLPAGRKPLTVKWVLKRKLAPDGSIARYKARLVARGFQQVQGYDFTETYSGVVKDVSSRILFAIAAALGWHVHQMDFTTAFLNGDLAEEIYICAPEGYRQQGRFLRLLKAIYGLKQAPRVWYKKLRAWLLQSGFHPIPQDECVFKSDDRQLVVTVYVDDLNIFGPDLEQIDDFKTEITAAFKITDIGPAAWYLGMEIKQTEQGILLHQGAYARQILAAHGCENAAPSPIPLDVNKRLALDDTHTASDAQKSDYLSKNGSANWLATKTRPDLAFPVSYTSRYNANPGTQHEDAVTHVYRYIANDPDAGIFYHRNGSLQLTGYVDSDWAGCKDTKRSTTGYVFMLAGGPVAWVSQRQKTVSTSSTHAEYVAASEATKEAYWIRGFMNELSTLNPAIEQGAVPLHIDNDSALKLTKNPEAHARTRHIDIRYHYIREQVEEGTIQPLWISGKHNPADMLTKPLSLPALSAHRAALGITNSTAASSAVASEAGGDTAFGVRVRGDVEQ